MSLKRQTVLYVISGGLQLGLDTAVFIGLSNCGVPIIYSVFIGRVAGALLGFWLNGKFTFSNNGHAKLGKQRFIRFSLVWLFLTGLSILGTLMVEHLFNLQTAWIAKPFIEVLIAILAFFMWKFIVYR